MPVVEQKTNHHNNDDFTPAWRSLKIAKKKCDGYFGTMRTDHSCQMLNTLKSGGLNVHLMIPTCAFNRSKIS